MPSFLALSVLGLATSVRALPKQEPTLDWKPCPELNEQIFSEIGIRGNAFDCASLTVPLDYTEPETSEKLELSLFKVNATKEPVLGSLLYNPGGPGGPGAQNLPFDSIQLNKHIGGQYHLISWDPRGTGKTIPFNCSVPAITQPLAERSESVSSNNSDENGSYFASANLTTIFLNGGWDSAVTLAESCAETQKATGAYLGTTTTAHDMLSIVNALGEDGLLRFYGYSYGTVLGEYFAALFPDRVERMVLDATFDPIIWKLGHRGNFLQDADATLRAFVDECLKAAQDCAIVNATQATTSEEIFAWLNAQLSPLAVSANSYTSESYQSLLAIKAITFRSLLNPGSWPGLARTLVAISQGDLDGLSGPTVNPDLYDEGANSIDGIRCSDSMFQVGSAEEYLPQVEYQAGISESFSDSMYNALWTCAAWQLPPNKGRYEGDFRTKTRHPILFLGGSYDVTTPVEGARNASLLFEGSVVLEHSGYGHGIVVSSSACVGEILEGYFGAEALLPEEGKVCEPDFATAWELAAAQSAELADRLIPQDSSAASTG